jgi:hypothetical protein
MANLITWWGLLEQARSSAFVTTPGPLDTPQSALIVLSRARRELQDFTNAVKRVVTVNIDGTSLTGGYPLPLDIKQPLEADFTPSGTIIGNGKIFRCRNLPPEAMDQLQREGQWWPSDPLPNPLVVRDFFYTIDQEQLFIYPWQSVIGTFSMRYLPFLHEFQPSNLVGDWAGVTMNALQTWMSNNGPDREFWASAGAMSDYLAIDLMQKHNVHKAYPERFAALHSGWEQGKIYAVKNTVIQSKGVMIPRRNSPLK